VCCVADHTILALSLQVRQELPQALSVIGSGEVGVGGAVGPAKRRSWEPGSSASNIEERGRASRGDGRLL
jgi:hypothetical protein